MSQFEMTIKEAKEEIIHTLRAYRMKNELGQYKIPVEKQRPILLMGPPGIGKTAIMEQIAAEEGIALVSYTITHHTRQSAVGLPVIREKKFGDMTCSATEYTMSEIVAALYEKIEQTGISEGILFLDEINCVSETLAPTMLQFLQYKTFGVHRIPAGFMIVAAGNPPEYNKSARDFDIATLDRLKRIDTTWDYSAWKEYAYAEGVHPAILSYLDIKKENFYQVHAALNGEDFVTARGWEDLSRFLLVRETMGVPVTAATIHQYIQHPEIARDFSSYYDLFQKYRQKYDIPAILDGEEQEEAAKRLGNSPFDEAVSVLGLFLGRLGEEFSLVCSRDQTLSLIYEALQRLKGMLASCGRTAAELLQDEYDRLDQRRETEKIAGGLTEEREKQYLAALSELASFRKALLSEQPEEEFSFIKAQFETAVSGYDKQAEEARGHLTNAFLFLEKALDGRQEMVLFVTELTLNPHASWFVAEHGCDKFFEYNKELLLEEKKSQLKKEVQTLQSVHRFSRI